MNPAQPSFWNARYAQHDWAYGQAPNAFLAAHVAQYVTQGSTVLELGAGEGRNSLFLARRGYQVTAVDYAAVGLAKAAAQAEKEGLALDTRQADLTQWAPGQSWDAMVVSFLHLPPAVRPGLYATMRDMLRPGGWLLAEWFRPAQYTRGYTSGGPKAVPMLITPEELRAHFPAEGLHLLEAADPVLDEGPYHQGPAATVRLIWHKGN